MNILLSTVMVAIFIIINVKLWNENSEFLSSCPHSSNNFTQILRKFFEGLNGFFPLSKSLLAKLTYLKFRILFFKTRNQTQFLNN